MSLDSSVDKLAKASQTLNDFSDALNGKLREIENRLEAVGVGVSAWLDDPIWPAKGDPFRIGWGRDGRTWSFFWTEDLRPLESLQQPGVENLYNTLSAAPRVVRIAAFPAIEKLVDQLTASVMAELAEFAPLDEVLTEAANARARARKKSPGRDEVPF